MSNLSEIKPVGSGRSRLRWYYNRTVQWGALLLMGQWSAYGLLRCPFVIPYISCQNCPVITCHGRILQFFWGVWAGWVALAILFGRAFCGWACPGGLISRVLAGLWPRKTEIPLENAGQLAYGKYLVLGFLILVFFGMGQPRVDVPIRIGQFFESIWLTWTHASELWKARVCVVGGALLLGIFVSAFWCRFLCPAGGLLELVKRFSLFTVYKTGECNNCGICREKCYMRTRPEEYNCTNCGDCIHSCPKNCIGIGRKA
ncbi:MAG: 4Fe-4S binding protein [Deltaproteobacteria bacterium]|jgi:polyferredoxin|nr:4Fe-4S binding protein [Deltaproteobacteria bacterium]